MLRCSANMIKVVEELKLIIKMSCQAEQIMCWYKLKDGVGIKIIMKMTSNQQLQLIFDV